MKTDGRQHIWLPEAGNTHFQSSCSSKQNKPKQRNSKRDRDCSRQISGCLSSTPTLLISLPLVAQARNGSMLLVKNVMDLLSICQNLAFLKYRHYLKWISSFHWKFKPLGLDKIWSFACVVQAIQQHIKHVNIEEGTLVSQLHIIWMIKKELEVKCLP